MERGRCSSLTNERTNGRKIDIFQLTFPEHLPLSKVQLGLKSGQFLQGSFQASRENYLEANVFVQDSEKYNQVGTNRSRVETNFADGHFQLFVQGYRNLNRAVHDDIVAVEVLPEEEWAIPFSLVIDDKDDDRGDLVIEQEETGLVVPGTSSKKIASCRVVAIIKRNWRQYCGILQESLPGVRFRRSSSIVHVASFFSGSISFVFTARKTNSENSNRESSSERTEEQSHYGADRSLAALIALSARS